MAETGVPEGWTVGAERQSAGRGRHGRAWVSPPGAGIYVSIVLRPPAHAVALLTLAAGVAVAEAIQAVSGADARVKWPNDVYLGATPATGKVAGILAEGGVSGTRVDHVVVGIGINVQPAALPPDVARRATSIEGELGRHADRGEVFAEVCAGRVAALSAARGRRRARRARRLAHARRRHAGPACRVGRGQRDGARCRPGRGCVRGAPRRDARRPRQRVVRGSPMDVSGRRHRRRRVLPAGGAAPLPAQPGSPGAHRRSLLRPRVRMGRAGDPAACGVARHRSLRRSSGTERSSPEADPCGPLRRGRPGRLR